MPSFIPPFRNDSGKTLMDKVEDGILPLINLVFLLLLFFIAVGHLSDDPLPPLPATPAEGDTSAPAADIVIDEKNRWLINQQIVNADQLAQKLPAPDDAKPLRVAAYADISMEELESLFRELEKAGYDKLSLLTEPTL